MPAPISYKISIPVDDFEYTARTNIIKLQPTRTQKRSLRKYLHGYEVVFNLANEYIKSSGECNLSVYQKIKFPKYIPKTIAHTAAYECVRVWEAEYKRRKTLWEKGDHSLHGKVEIKNRTGGNSMLICKRDFGAKKEPDKEKCRKCQKPASSIDYCQGHYAQLPRVGNCPYVKADGATCNHPMKKGYQFCLRHSRVQLPGFYVNDLGSMKGMEEMDRPEHDFRLVKTGSNYYLHIPADLKKTPTKGTKTIALDPGVRKFQTGYCPETGKVTYFRPPKEKLEKLFKLIDEYQYHERRAKTRSHRRKLKYLRLRAIGKVKRIVKNLRNQTANTLTKENKVIIVGKFGSKKASEGNLPSSVNRMMRTLSHYNFRQHLKFKCFERGCQYIEVNEAYTTQICHCCNYRNQNVGGSEVYHCPHCGEIDRDANSAINIFRKATGQFPMMF